MLKKLQTKILNFFTMDNILFLVSIFNNIQEKPIVVIIPSFNNSKWYKKNLDSVFQQKYSNYKIVYIDDFSTDNTGELAEHYIQKNNQLHRTTIIKNNIRKGATANRYYGSHLCNDNDIVIILDGDDWLANKYIFKFINYIYTTENIWLTYGQFKKWPSNEIGHCKRLPQNYNFRKMNKWYTSHLRTYYAWLFKKISKSDLLDVDNNFFGVAGDVSEMLPMLEMARGHIRFINKILYIYNVQTPLNDFKINLEKQLQNTRKIQSKKSYAPTSII